MEKIWFITGCSKGFGRALVEQLLETTNSFVVATARKPETLHDLEKSYASRILVLPLDVMKNDQIQKAVDAAIQRFKRIDVLVNNAGYGLVGAFEECAMEDIRHVFDTNVFGLMAMTQAVLPHMRHQKSGHIINLSSVAGLVSMAGASIYNSTKFAVEGLSEGIALEVAPFGIKTTIIEPGPFRTDFAGDSIKISPLNLEYADSPANAIREYMTQTNRNQAGDPIKAARIMIQLTHMDHPPLRLPLGNIALERIALKFDAQAREFAKYETLARSADYTSSPESS